MRTRAPKVPKTIRTYLKINPPQRLCPPTPPAGAFFHPNPSMAPTGCPQAAIPGRLPPQTTPDTRPLKTRRQLLHSNVQPEAQAHRRTHPLHPQDAPRRRSPPALRKRTPRQGSPCPAPGQGPPEAHPPAKTLLLKRGKRSPSYIEKRYAKRGRKPATLRQSST